MPKRIQRHRTKGWRMPANAVYVGRPTKWGNPWTESATRASGLFKPECVREVIVTEFRAWLLKTGSPNGEEAGIYHTLQAKRAAILASLEELRGKDLACWCPLDQPCHADVLLELANREPSA